MRVAIIGAGIIGLYLAWKLAEKGNEVTVFEKRGKIGKRCCSGLFSERILDFIPESEKLIQNQIESVLIRFPKKTVKISFSRKFFVMDHAELDKLTASLAERAGVKIRLNFAGSQSGKIKSMLNAFDRIVGCDGALSQVRRSLALKNPQFRMGMQRFVSQKDNSSYVETRAIKGGFSWKIPRGNSVEYGAVLPVKSVENFRREKYDSFALIPQGFIVPKNDKITLCGDAAGLTKPWSGGGVVWGLTAADLLLKNFPDFLKYRNGLKGFFLPKIILSKLATKAVYSIGFAFPWVLPKNIKIEGDFLL